VSSNWSPSVYKSTTKKKVFVSFDWDNDKHYKFMLNAWNANPDFDFVFSDQTPKEIQSDDIGRIKAAITTKINRSTHTLVIVGKYANTWHKDSKEIGYRNWINFEIHQSKENKNEIIAVFLLQTNEEPDEFAGFTVRRIYGFDQEPLENVLKST
jgi:hypothetical protein